MALLGSMTLSKMATKMAAILDFTKNSNLSEKCESCKHILQNVIYLNILLLLVAFFAGFFNFFFNDKGKKTRIVIQ